MANLICIKTYNNRQEAELVKGFLGASSIKAAVSADDVGGMRPDVLLITGGVRLLVMEENAQEALEVLEDTRNK